MIEFVKHLFTVIAIYLKIVVTLPFKKIFYTRTFWKELFDFLFKKLFWYGLTFTIMMLFMIPAMKGGQISILGAIFIATVAAVFANVMSGTWVNPWDAMINFFQKTK